MKTISEEQNEKILNAIRAVYSLTIAKSKSNHSTCGCYHIKPFKTHWDKKTVDEVAESINLYVRTWILFPLADAMDVDISQIEDSLKLKELRSQVLKLEHKMSKITNKK